MNPAAAPIPSEAEALMLQGQNDAALVRLNADVAARPAEPAALAALGEALALTGHIAPAFECLKLALAGASEEAAIVATFGRALLLAGETEAARAAAAQARRLDPSGIETRFLESLIDGGKALPIELVKSRPYRALHLRLLAQRAIEAARLDEARQLIAYMREAGMGGPDFLVLEGALLALGGDIKSAEPLFRAALAANPNHLDALKFLAKQDMERGAYHNAALMLDRLAALKGGDETVLRLLAAALSKSKQFPAAIAVLSHMIDKGIDDAALRIERGTCYGQNAEFEKGRTDFAVAETFAPLNAGVFAGRAGLEVAAGNAAAAEAAVARALELDPQCGAALGNLAMLRSAQGRFEEALDLYRGSLALIPNDPTAHHNLSLLLLRFGLVQEAWPHFAWRWDVDDAAIGDKTFGLKRWDGLEKPPGRLLIRREQGVGDELLFAALIPELRLRGIEPVLMADPRLAGLFKRGMPGLEVVPSKPPPDARALGLEYEIPIGDLAPILRPEKPLPLANKPYIAADPARVDLLRRRYATFGARRVFGISWRSRNPHMGDFKSLKLADLLPILRLPGCVFVNLQYGDCAAEIANLAREHGIALHADPEIDPLTDLEGQAAQVQALDGVISVSTAVVHIACALAKPVHVLLPFERGLLWYWGHDGSSTPWRPSARLYRPAHAGDWDAVIEQCRTALAAESGD